MTLVLDDDEALVLFEWLARSDARDAFPVDDPAEEKVLQVLHGQLQRTLVDPFRPNYRELVEQARARIKTAAGL